MPNPTEPTTDHGSRLIRIDLDALARHYPPIDRGRHRIERVDTRHISPEERARILAAAEQAATAPAPEPTIVPPTAIGSAPAPPAISIGQRARKVGMLLRNLGRNRRG